MLGKPLGLKDCIIVGGMGTVAERLGWAMGSLSSLPLSLTPPSTSDMVTQALELSRKPHVVIATPGRLADHLRSSNTFNMKKIRFLVSQLCSWD